MVVMNMYAIGLSKLVYTKYQNYLCYIYVTWIWGTKVHVLGGLVYLIQKGVWTRSTPVHTPHPTTPLLSAIKILILPRTGLYLLESLVWHVFVYCAAMQHHLHV